MLPYLARRGTHTGPLFLMENGQGLTRQYFCTAINAILTELQLIYNSHSFRIGAATTAAQANIPEAYIKTLGRWQSDAYIKTSPHELAKFSSVLASASDKVLHSP